MIGGRRFKRFVFSGTAHPGFTLLEVMVAMAILGISIVVLMELFAMGLKSAKASQDYTKIIMLAQEKMEGLSLQGALAEGMDKGEFEGTPYRWETEIKPYRPEEAREGEPTILSAALSDDKGQAAAFSSKKELPFEIFEIKVRVLWGDEKRPKSFELKTIRTFVKAPKLEAKGS